MNNTTIEISANSHATLQQLAREEGLSLQALLDKALRLYRRQAFLNNVNKAYATLRQDSVAWEGVREEREAWDTTVEDGLQENKV